MRTLLFLFFLTLAAVPTQASLGQRGPGLLAAATDFLPVEAAYRPTAWLTDDGRLRIDWQLADGYYLYRHAFRATDPATGGGLPLALPEGIERHDEFFGDVEVYYHTLS